MSDTITTAYSAALDAMQRTGPKSLHEIAEMLADQISLDGGAALAAHLQSAGPEDALRQRLHHALAAWDYAETDGAWAAGTKRNSPERRAAINSALGVDVATAELFEDLFPVATADAPIVIADEWEEWRTPQRRAERDFYSAHYRRYLRSKGWSPEAVVDLDEAAEQVVSRLADPMGATLRQARGLVVGYVQSGKTANFTGVIAKAVDAGYRLIIVLTGTTNMLRAQTQRRLDMELCGRENIELEISPHDDVQHEYENDPDWIKDKFIRHGGRPSDSGFPDLRRLSSHTWDYKRLRLGFAALEFRRRERNRPFYDPANLYTSDARLIVVKKNGPVLKGLVADLGRISDKLADVPVLVIDDESDQASVNTTSPTKWRNDQKQRTVINARIAELLRMMPRAQYVGYTATPYANVFIDPSDVEDIFPRDFLISLRRPRDYMGPEDFHDLDDDRPLSERPLETSRERAHVRLLDDEPNEVELRDALDMFVLTGAVKVYRERIFGRTFRHHTMLVHEAMGKASHTETAILIRTLWDRGGYYSAAGLGRLQRLYEQDVMPVSCAKSDDPQLPSRFEDLHGDLAIALRRIRPADPNASPVIVVNSDKELERQQESLDFDRRSIWRILVGGNKLARGFTVEGLTVTYYRRATKQIDTLMQMGRWFGYRHGYRDLVRLYTTSDLHDMFEAACRDEEYLRTELRRYAPREGIRQITPKQIPPLIAQHRPDLRPTGRNKMWNAQITEKSSPGDSTEPVAYPQGPAVMRRNVEQWLPVLRMADRRVSFQVAGANTRYDASIAIVPHKDMLAVLDGLTWLTPETFVPELNGLKNLTPGQLEEWIVLIPHQTRIANERTILGCGPFSIVERNRNRMSTGAFKAFSERRHRNAAFRIAGVTEDTEPDHEADALSTGRRGAIVLYPSVEGPDLEGSSGGPIDPSRVTIGFLMITPKSTAPSDGRLIKWVVKDSSQRTAIAVPST